MNDLRVLQKRLAITAFVVISVHVMVGAVMLTLPGLRSLPGVGRFYRQFILLGPYFSDQSIRSSHHLYVAYHHGGKWSARREFWQEDFDRYCAQPWRYDKLHRRDYPRFLAWQISQQTDAGGQLIRQAPQLKSLVGFVQNEWIKQPVDSMAIIFCSRSFQVETNSFHVDTLFNQTCATGDRFP